MGRDVCHSALFVSPNDLGLYMRGEPISERGWRQPVLYDRQQVCMCATSASETRPEKLFASVNMANDLSVRTCLGSSALATSQQAGSHWRMAIQVQMYRRGMEVQYVRLLFGNKKGKEKRSPSQCPTVSLSKGRIEGFRNLWSKLKESIHLHLIWISCLHDFAVYMCCAVCSGGGGGLLCKGAIF